MRNTLPLAMLRSRLRNMTQKDLARKLGVSTTYMSQLLRGQREFGPLILNALGLEVTYRRKKSRRKKRAGKTAPTEISVESGPEPISPQPQP